MATALEQILATAREYGWTVHIPEDRWEVYVFTRRNPADRRQTEYLRLTFDVREYVLTTTWEPRTDGVGGRNFDTRKRERTLAQLTGWGKLVK